MSRASGRGRKDNWKLNGYYGKIGEAQKIQQEVIYHEYSRDKRHDNRESCPFTAGIFHAADAGESFSAVLYFCRCTYCGTVRGG